jgi:predicted Rossmann-fold nucleotide-binding protein
MTLLGQLGVPGIMPAIAEGAICNAVVSSGIFPVMKETWIRALNIDDKNFKLHTVSKIQVLLDHFKMTAGKYFYLKLAV